MENVTKGRVRRNRKAPLQEEIAQVLRDRNQELRQDGLEPLSMERAYNEKGVPLRIDSSMRVNLSVTPELYQKALRVGSEVEMLIKLDINPASSRYWYGLLDIVADSLDVLREKKKEAEAFQAHHDAIMAAFKFKQTGGL